MRTASDRTRGPPSLRALCELLTAQSARDIRTIAPALSSVSSQIEPSGATLTSRMRPNSPSNRRSSPVIAPDLCGRAAQKLEFQRADEQVAVPFREHAALIDRQSRRRDGGVPIVERLLVAGSAGTDADLPPE